MEFKEFEEDAESLFSAKISYTFLVGAGISIPKPTALASAREIVRNLLEFCAPTEELENLLSLEKLRFELVIEKIQDELDEDLKFLDYLETVSEPNLIHLFLGHAITRGSYVITTNFDYLIERALMRILDKQWHQNIIPIITKEDFLKLKGPKELIYDGKYPIYKIHGSKRNIITGEYTKGSLITTISALGKEREEGKTFAIEPYKKQTVYNLMKQRTLVVMGYSGTDDFDIGPMLKELPFLKRIIWIEHSPQNKIEIIKIKDYKVSKDQENFSYTEQFLMDVSSTGEFDVILVKAHTETFIQTVLWPKFLPHVSIKDLKLVEFKKNTPTFSEWIKPLYEKVSVIKKHKLAIQLFYFLKQLDATTRCSERGITLADEHNNLSAKSYFLNFLGLVNQITGNYNKALKNYEEALQIDDSLEDLAGKAADYNNIGTIHLTWGNYDAALENNYNALRIADEINDFSGKIVNLNNIGRLYEIRGEFDQALTKYREGLKIAEKIGDLSRKAALLNNIGMIYGTSEDYNLALEQYKEALKISEQLGDLYGKIILENNIGHIYHESGNLDAALDQFFRTVDIAEQLGDLSKKAGCLNNIGSIYLAQGKLDLALEKYKEALYFEELLGDPLMKVIYLNNIGTIYNTQAKYDLASEAYVEALNIVESLGLPSKKALLLTKIGGIKLIQEDFWGALDTYEKAILIFEELGELSNKAASLSNIGKIYEKFGSYRKALNSYKDALQIDENKGDIMGRASDLYNLGRIYEILQEYHKAINHFEKSLIIFKQLEQKQYVEVITQKISDLRKKTKSI